MGTGAALLGGGCMHATGDRRAGTAAERPVILWPASAQLLIGQEAKAPSLAVTKDQFGLDAWRSVQLPSQPGASLAWNVEVDRAGEYEAYIEFQVTAPDPKNQSSTTAVGFRLEAGSSAATGEIYRTEHPYAREMPSFILQRVGRIRLDAGRGLLRVGSFTGLDELSVRWGAVCLRPATNGTPDYGSVRRAIDDGREWMAPDRLGLPGIIGDHMVLQRDARVPIWGRAQPGAKVRVAFGGQKKSARADTRGFWRVRLDPMKAGGPYELVIRAGQETKTFVDVLVGEVWLGIGQSNMTWALSHTPALGHISDQATQDFVGKGDFPRIRVSSYAHHLVTTNHGGWMPMPEVQTRYLPALMTCMSILLHREQQVPVGIVVRAYGGVTGSVWMDRPAFEDNPDVQQGLTRYEKSEYPAQFAQYETALAAWKEKAAAAKAKGEAEPAKANPPAPSGLFWADGGSLDAGYLVPLCPFAVKGIVWDQGESGTGIPGVSQQAMLAGLVAGWRDEWGQPALPVIYIRKDQYGQGQGFADFTNRLGQVTNCWMVDNEGLSHALHPPDKLEYAKRLMSVMTNQVYAVRRVEGR